MNNNQPATYYIQRLIKLYFNGKLRAKYNIEKSRSMQTYSAQAIDYSKKQTATSKTNNINHEIDDYMAAKCEAEQRASFLRLLIDEVEEALDTLICENELENGKIERIYDDYNLLKWSYQRIPNYTDEQIGDRLHIVDRTVRRKRDELITELTKLININYYINSPIKDIGDYFDNLIDG